ncbi:hypothetical protein F5B19DRAFT_504269 [Rostrohypoxylon terebratum]|nr:hypothetical protein F5B19DRAFT_504269 [Rostrohypoxylon terebratum]
MLNLTLKKNSSKLKPISINKIIERAKDGEDLNKLGKNLLDSFALIFAQPGPEGVIATVMEKREPNTYVLHIAKNNGDCAALSELAISIQVWFGMRGSYPVTRLNLRSHIDDPTFENSCWQQILHACYPNIRKTIYEVCFAKLRNMKDARNYHFAPVREVIYDITSTNDCYNEMRLAAHGLISALDNIYQLNEFYLGWKDRRRVHRLGEIQCEKIRWAHELISRCYELLERYKEPMDQLIKLYNRKVSSDKPQRSKIQVHGLSLKRVKRLIYHMAQYRRAWYDMVRFKLDHSSATLEIDFIPHDTVGAACKADNTNKAQVSRKSARKRHSFQVDCRGYPYSLQTKSQGNWETSNRASSCIARCRY